MIPNAGLIIHWKMVHQLNVIQIIKMDTPAVLFMDGVEIHQVILHKENSRCIHLKIYFNGEMIPNAGLIIQWEMVHQLNVTQIIKMDTPAVLFMDGVEIQWLIVHVMVALITVKVNFEKKTLLYVYY